MHGVSKKMFISILTSVIVMVTMVATTFAWVGIFTYASTENFSINLRVYELDLNYYLTISATGEKGSFSDMADLTEIRRKILKNQGKWSDSILDNYSSETISALYGKNSYLTPSTTTISNNMLTDFKAINLLNNDRFEYHEARVPYLKFDLYLSVDTKEGIQDTSSINSNVYMAELENTLIGTISSYKFLNGNQFKSLPSADTILKSLPELSNFNINSKNAVRFAFCIFNPIDINDSYSNELPTKTIIYQGGTQNPSIDGDVYNLGGNLPEDSNTALKELLVIRPSYKENSDISYMKNYEDALNSAIIRGQNDLELVESNSKIWTKPANPSHLIDDNGNKTYNFLGVNNGTQTKMKIEVYFWFEGWDSDCLSGINEMPVSLNLTFTAGIED